MMIMSNANVPARPKPAIAPGLRAEVEEDAAAASVTEAPGVLEGSGAVGSGRPVVDEGDMGTLNGAHEKARLEALGTVIVLPPVPESEGDDTRSDAESEELRTGAWAASLGVCVSLDVVG